MYNRVLKNDNAERVLRKLVYWNCKSRECHVDVSWKVHDSNSITAPIPGSRNWVNIQLKMAAHYDAVQVRK